MAHVGLRRYSVGKSICFANLNLNLQYLPRNLGIAVQAQTPVFGADTGRYSAWLQNSEFSAQRTTLLSQDNKEGNSWGRLETYYSGICMQEYKCTHLYMYVNTLNIFIIIYRYIFLYLYIFIHIPQSVVIGAASYLSAQRCPFSFNPVLAISLNGEEFSYLCK